MIFCAPNLKTAAAGLLAVLSEGELQTFLLRQPRLSLLHVQRQFLLLKTADRGMQMPGVVDHTARGSHL